MCKPSFHFLILWWFRKAESIKYELALRPTDRSDADEDGPDPFSLGYKLSHDRQRPDLGPQLTLQHHFGEGFSNRSLYTERSTAADAGVKGSAYAGRTKSSKCEALDPTICWCTHFYANRNRQQVLSISEVYPELFIRWLATMLGCFSICW